MKKRLLGDNKALFFIALIIGIMYSAVAVYVPILSGELVTSVVESDMCWTKRLFLFISVSLLQIFFSELNEYTTNTFKIRQKSFMRKKMFSAFLKNDGAKREDISFFVSFVNNDIPAIVEQYFLGTIDMVECLCIIVFSACSLMLIHWKLAIIIVGISILIVCLPSAMRERGGSARKKYSNALGQYNNIIQSFLDGLCIIKTYRAKAYSIGKADLSDAEVVVKEKILLKLQLIIQGLTTILQVSKTALILIIGVSLVAEKKMDIGELVATIQLASVISAPIEVLAYLRHSKNEAVPLIEKYSEIIDDVEKNSIVHKEILSKVGQIEFNHVSYNIEGLDILKDVSAKFDSGGKYLITGESGSGKSTLLRLLSRVGDLNYRGDIWIDGTEIRTMTTDGYYNNICPVFQESYLFQVSLEENICLGREISQEIFDDVVGKLNLKYLIERYQSQEMSPKIVENLSGGEKQRIALARAMVGNPIVYLLDEVTSSLDKNNADEIEKVLLEQASMVIHICHKPNILLAPKYNCTYELVNGVLVKLES